MARLRPHSISSSIIGLALAGGISISLAQEITVGPIDPNQGAPTFVPGELIVKFRDDAPTETNIPALNAAGVQRRAGPDGSIVFTFPSVNDPTVESVPGTQPAFELESGPLPEGTESVGTGANLDDIIEQLEATGSVEYAEKNYLHTPHDGPPPPPLQALIPDDPLFDQQWHLKLQGASHGAKTSPGASNFAKLWPKNVGKREIVVAVLDTGILFQHPDVTGNRLMLDGYDFISTAFVGNDGDGRDPDATDAGDAVDPDECFTGSFRRGNSWHGSHVAGISSGAISDNKNGIASGAWEVRTLPVRVLGKCGGFTSDINDAILWAAGLPVQGVPENRTPADVINMSLGAGVSCRASTQSVINQAVAAGATIVVSAGNSAVDASNASPAGCDNVISVAAGDARGQIVQRYSNFGPQVDILAAGGDLARDDDRDGNPDGVLSLVDGGYAYYNGTSMAAPLVAGAAALLLSIDDTLTPAAVEAKLKATADPRSTAQCPRGCGAGLLDVSSF
ncbi:MAG: S8 family peptidase [Pseudomonadota bacterium]